MHLGEPLIILEVACVTAAWTVLSGQKGTELDGSAVKRRSGGCDWGPLQQQRFVAFWRSNTTLHPDDRLALFQFPICSSRSVCQAECRFVGLDRDVLWHRGPRASSTPKIHPVRVDVSLEPETCCATLTESRRTQLGPGTSVFSLGSSKKTRSFIPDRALCHSWSLIFTRQFLER